MYRGRGSGGGRGNGGGRRGGRKPTQPTEIRGGKVSKRVRGGLASGRGGILTRIANSIPSSSGPTGGQSTSAAAHSAVPSSSRAYREPASTASQPSSKKEPSSSSATQLLPNQNAVAAARSHLLSSGVVVTFPPINSLTLRSRNLIRIKGDLMELHKYPPPGIHVVQDDKDMTVMHVIITGPIGTPYEGGFFYFLVICHADYPSQPPKVKFMTTGAGTVRFNPNLYTCGNVCLSVLGTWPGPNWSPVQTLSSLLIQIQSSVFNEQPYFNEPGFVKEKRKGDILKYNSFLLHETIRVAVIGMVNNDFKLSIPKELMDQMNRSFLTMYDIYETKLISNLHLNGTDIAPPHFGKLVKFQHATLLDRLRNLKDKLSRQSKDPTPTPSCSGEPSRS